MVIFLGGWNQQDGTNKIEPTKCHGARAKPSTLAPLKLCKLCCYAATLYPAFTLLLVFMASSFPSWMGFSLFCSARHQSPFMGLVPAFTLLLVFIASLLSLLSNAKDGPKRGRGRKGLFEAWKYLKRKDVVPAALSGGGPAASSR